MTLFDVGVGGAATQTSTAMPNLALLLEADGCSAIQVRWEQQILVPGVQCEQCGYLNVTCMRGVWSRSMKNKI